jgi:hypothetical protein
MPTQHENIANLLPKEVVNASEKLFFKAGLYISQATDATAEKKRAREVILLFEKLITNLNGRITDDCPPGKKKDRETGLCI